MHKDAIFWLYVKRIRLHVKDDTKT